MVWKIKENQKSGCSVKQMSLQGKSDKLDENFLQELIKMTQRLRMLKFRTVLAPTDCP